MKIQESTKPAMPEQSRSRHFCAWLLAFWLVAVGSPSRASENWPQWRGPSFNGSGTATGLPSVWSATENVAWKTPLPGAGGATPVVWEDRVFVTSLDDETKDLIAYCIDRTNGKILWEEVVGIGFSDEGRGRNMASPSPVTDGKKVIFLFGSSDLAAFDFDGKQLWKRNLQEDHGPFHILFGYHASPLLYHGKLFVQILHRGHPIDGPGTDYEGPRESFLLAIDPETGKDLWKQIRPSEAVEESRESYSTPIPYEGNGRPEVLVFGGDCITGHDPDTGRELWRWGSWNPRKISHWRVVPTPVTSPGLIYVCAPKGEPVFAIKGGGGGLLDDSAIAWKLEKHTSDVCVPLVYGERLYVLDGDGKFFTCLDRSSGEVKWVHRFTTQGIFRGSPAGADGKIYLITEEGEIFVVAAEDAFRQISEFVIGESPCRSTPVAIRNQLLVRTGENLYCIQSVD